MQTILKESDIDIEENTNIFGNMESGYSTNTNSETGRSELPDGTVGGDKQASTAESKLQTDTELDTELLLLEKKNYLLMNEGKTFD